ncbi:MAG: NAD(P)H-hydrate dehydratase [Lachnospiraceae bacterium]|jgi:hydroxyethylthiazole kinase-like uncharacterized protein yjeF
MVDINEKYVKERFVRRGIDTHKGDCGRILIYAGSQGMAGAAALCGIAALRSGSGLVRFLVPDINSHLGNTLQRLVPEATCVAYEKEMPFSKYDAVVCGPGLGQYQSKKELLGDIISRYAGVLVLDADALNMIAAESGLRKAVKESKASIIMTPHIGEARRLLGAPSKPLEGEKIKSKEEREGALRELVEQYNAIIVLKGHESMIGTPGADYYINTTGNPGMATGGTGDVLTGVIAALAGQGYSPEEAASIGTYIHGLAGDLTAGELGQIGMIASDIVAHLPFAFRKFHP